MRCRGDVKMPDCVYRIDQWLVAWQVTIDSKCVCLHKHRSRRTVKVGKFVSVKIKIIIREERLSSSLQLLNGGQTNAF